jgi:hypothetical protein
MAISFGELEALKKAKTSFEAFPFEWRRNRSWCLVTNARRGRYPEVCANSYRISSSIKLPGPKLLWRSPRKRISMRCPSSLPASSPVPKGASELEKVTANTGTPRPSLTPTEEVSDDVTRDGRTYTGSNPW